jgi:hypothetical protein
MVGRRVSASFNRSREAEAVMIEADISLFAELLHSRFGASATAEAQRWARHFDEAGDVRNAHAWRLILQHVRAMKHAPPQRHA